VHTVQWNLCISKVVQVSYAAEIKFPRWQQQQICKTAFFQAKKAKTTARLSTHSRHWFHLFCSIFTRKRRISARNMYKITQVQMQYRRKVCYVVSQTSEVSTWLWYRVSHNNDHIIHISSELQWDCNHQLVERSQDSHHHVQWYTLQQTEQL